MKSMMRLLVLFGVLNSLPLRAAEPVSAAGAASKLPELRGLLVTGGERRFALSIPGGDGQTAWVGIGGSFAGWKLSAYRPAEDALVLVKDGREVLLKLSSSKIGVADEKATLADAEAVLGKMQFEKMIDKVLEQQKQATVGMLKKMLGNPKEVDPADYAAFQSKVMDTMYAAMKPDEMKADFARIYSDVFTKGELQGLANFYDSATGQALIEKQPEVQKKSMEVMMPRIMSAMPKIQQLGAEFTKEQAAKQASAAASKPSATAPGAAQ